MLYAKYRLVKQSFQRTNIKQTPSTRSSILGVISKRVILGLSCNANVKLQNTSPAIYHVYNTVLFVSIEIINPKNCYFMDSNIQNIYPKLFTVVSVGLWDSPVSVVSSYRCLLAIHRRQVACYTLYCFILQSMFMILLK